MVFKYDSDYRISLSVSMPWLWLLIVSFSQRRPAFNPRSVHARFVVDKVVVGRAGFCPSASVFPRPHYSTNAPCQYSFNSCSYQDDTTGKALRTTRSECYFVNRVSPDNKSLNLSRFKKATDVVQRGTVHRLYQGVPDSVRTTLIDSRR